MPRSQLVDARASPQQTVTPLGREDQPRHHGAGHCDRQVTGTQYADELTHGDRYNISAEDDLLAAAEAVGKRYESAAL
jgi:hypothetical protein